MAGDYKIVIVGHQNDLLGIKVPLSDLPYEVYGGTNFSVGHEPGMRVYFRVPEGVAKQTVGGYKGHVQVLKDAGQVVADTRKGGYQDKKAYNNLIDFTPDPKVLYRIERQCFYFRANPAIYITFFPNRWFAPSPDLDAVKWWHSLVP